jgi:hypothetical protein
MSQPQNPTLTSSNLWLRAWTPDGFQLSLTLPIATVADALVHLDAVRAAGLLPSEPGIEPGQEKETVDTVVKRYASDGTPIIDFYPAWSHGGKYGVHKYAHLYMNSADDIAEFERQSGVRFAELPIFAGQSPLKRAPEKAHPCEVKVARSFQIVRTPDGEHETGMPKYRYSYFMPALASADPAPADPEPEPVDAPVAPEPVGTPYTASEPAPTPPSETPKGNGHTSDIPF